MQGMVFRARFCTVRLYWTGDNLGEDKNERERERERERESQQENDVQG